MNKIQLTETDLKKVVYEATKRILVKEGLVGDVGRKISNTFDDAFRGYKVKEGNPRNIKDVFNSDGWKIVKHEMGPNREYFEVTKSTGAFGGHYGIPIEEMEEELNIFLNGRGVAKRIGRNVDNKAERFEIIYK